MVVVELLLAAAAEWSRFVACFGQDYLAAQFGAEYWVAAQIASGWFVAAAHPDLEWFVAH